MRRPHETAVEAEGLLHILTAAQWLQARISHMFETQVEYLFVVSLLRLSAFSFLTRAEGGKKNGTAKKTPQVLNIQAPLLLLLLQLRRSSPPPTPASCALRPSRLFCVSVCSDELGRKRCAAAPDTVFHPPPTPQGRGVKSAPSHRACWPQCRVLVQLLTLCFIMRSHRKWGTARESDKGTNSCFTNLAFCFWHSLALFTMFLVWLCRCLMQMSRCFLDQG